MERDHTPYLQRCVELAAEAVEAGSDAFGSLLVDAAGNVIAEDRNRKGDGDPTAHPELALVRWAIANLSPSERAATTTYTSGEHCAMCAAAHAWAGLGDIVFASSAAQLTSWFAEAGLPDAPVAPLPISAVAPGVHCTGPFPDVAERVAALHRTRFARP